jgi:nucleoside-diphosphate-sugar epimerase
VSVRDIIKRVSGMIDIEAIIQEDAALASPVPLRYVSDITRAGEELDWRPQIGIDSGLRIIL